MLVNYFYNGMSPAMKQLLETTCGGDFMSKHPEEAMDFLNYVAETSKAWDEPNPREAERVRPVANQRGGMYSLPEDIEMKAKLSTLARRLEELEMRNQHEVRAVAEAPVHIQPGFICQSTDHQGEHWPTAPSMRDLMAEHANVVGQYKPPTNSNTTTHTNLTGETILTSPVNQTLMHMYPMVHNNSMVPHLNHSRHHSYLQLRKLF